jgi:hypothetical protein
MHLVRIRRSFLVPDSDPSLKLDQLSNLKMLRAHNRIAARPFGHFKAFLMKFVFNHRQSGPLYGLNF